MAAGSSPAGRASRWGKNAILIGPQNALRLPIFCRHDSKFCHRPESLRVDVITRARVRAVRAHDVDGASVDGTNVDAVAVRPHRPQVYFDHPSDRSAILHLNAPEPATLVRDDIKRLMLRQGREQTETAFAQVDLSVQDSEVTFVLRVMLSHRRDYRLDWLLRQQLVFGARALARRDTVLA